MTQRDDPMHSVLDRLVPAAVGVNDWPDVVRRAGTYRAADRSRLRRTALALLVTLGVTVPALAATGTLHALWRHRGPAIGVSAQLRDSSGAPAGRFEAELPGVFAGQDRPGHLLPHRVLHRGGLHPANSYPLHWRIALPRGAASSGRIVYRPGVAHAGRTVAQLCRPCGARAAGEVTLTRAAAALLLNGQLALRLQTRDGTVIGVVPRVNQNGLIPRRR